jgi:hypothetical protein
MMQPVMTVPCALATENPAELLDFPRLFCHFLGRCQKVNKKNLTINLHSNSLRHYSKTQKIKSFNIQGKQ